MDACSAISFWQAVWRSTLFMRPSRVTCVGFGRSPITKFAVALPARLHRIRVRNRQEQARSGHRRRRQNQNPPIAASGRRRTPACVVSTCPGNGMGCCRRSPGPDRAALSARDNGETTMPVVQGCTPRIYFPISLSTTPRWRMSGQIGDDPTNVFRRPPVPVTARPAQRDSVVAEVLFRSSGRRDAMRLAGVIVEILFGIGLTGFERTNSAMRCHVSVFADFQLPSRRRPGSGVAIGCPRRAMPATTGRHFQMSNADGRRVHAFGSPEPGLRSAGSGPGSEAQGNAPHGTGPVMVRGFGHAGRPVAP